MIRLFEVSDLPFDRSEALRYALCQKGMPSDRLDQLFPEANTHVHGRICYDIFPVHDRGNGEMDLGFSVFSSRSLSRLLENCSQCLVFAATIGIEYDRYAARISSLSQADGWILHALGTERIETLCNSFEAYLKSSGYGLTMRFSPGYGDVPLALQRDIFRALDCPRKIGLTLNASLLMSPSKSVTAILGLTDTPAPSVSPCSACSMKTCSFRSISKKTE